MLVSTLIQFALVYCAAALNELGGRTAMCRLRLHGGRSIVEECERQVADGDERVGERSGMDTRYSSLR